MGTKPNGGRSIDERLDFLLHSTESLHATAQLQSAQIADLAAAVAALLFLAKSHSERLDKIEGQ
jgi:hypothetical protein